MFSAAWIIFPSLLYVAGAIVLMLADEAWLKFGLIPLVSAWCLCALFSVAAVVYITKAEQSGATAKSDGHRIVIGCVLAGWVAMGIIAFDAKVWIPRLQATFTANRFAGKIDPAWLQRLRDNPPDIIVQEGMPATITLGAGTYLGMAQQGSGVLDITAISFPSGNLTPVFSFTADAPSETLTLQAPVSKYSARDQIVRATLKWPAKTTISHPLLAKGILRLPIKYAEETDEIHYDVTDSRTSIQCSLLLLPSGSGDPRLFKDYLEQLSAVENIGNVSLLVLVLVVGAGITVGFLISDRRRQSHAA